MNFWYFIAGFFVIMLLWKYVGQKLLSRTGRTKDDITVRRLLVGERDDLQVYSRSFLAASQRPDPVDDIIGWNYQSPVKRVLTRRQRRNWRRTGRKP